MTQNSNQNKLYLEMNIKYMIMQCLRFLQQADSNDRP